jgi:hypothetical protein
MGHFVCQLLAVLPREVIYALVVSADYQLASRLLSESSLRLDLCESPATSSEEKNKSFNLLNETKAEFPEDTNRRFIMTLVGIKPHRLNLWASSGRPGECIINWQLLNGVPTVVLPARREIFLKRLSKNLIEWFL